MPAGPNSNPPGPVDLTAGAANGAVGAGPSIVVAPLLKRPTLVRR